MSASVHECLRSTYLLRALFLPQSIACPKTIWQMNVCASH
jgi:hypothetical protein